LFVRPIPILLSHPTFLRLVKEYKNERSWLEEILLSYLAKGSLGIALSTRNGNLCGMSNKPWMDCYWHSQNRHSFPTRSRSNGFYGGL